MQEETGSVRRCGERAGQLAEVPAWSESKQGKGAAGPSLALPFISPGWAHPILCHFCSVLIEMQSTEGTYSFAVVF